MKDKIEITKHDLQVLLSYILKGVQFAEYVLHNNSDLYVKATDNSLPVIVNSIEFSKLFNKLESKVNDEYWQNLKQWKPNSIRYTLNQKYKDLYDLIENIKILEKENA